MKSVFVDTNYWIAAINPRDQLRARALEARRGLGEVLLATTEEVLTETLNHFAEHGQEARGARRHDS